MKTLFKLIILGILVSSCSSDEEGITIDSNEVEESSEVVIITSEQFDMQKMELDSISYRSFGGSVHCTGIIDIPAEFKADVSSYFGGYVKKVQLVTGNYVKQGEPLFYLENPEFIDVQREFLEKSNELELLKSEYERQAQLAKSNATSNKELNSAKSAYDIALVAQSSLKKKLQLMNINPDKLSAENIQSTISVNSPISGYVTAVNISKGLFLDPHQVAVSVDGVDHKHMELSVYEKDLAKIKIGDPIRMYTASNPTKMFPGEVHLIDKNIDPQTRTVKVHGHFTEDAETIKDILPQMYIEGEIISNLSLSPGLPESAVVAQDDLYYVLVLDKSSDNEYQFIKLEVKKGETINGYTEILNFSDLPKNAMYLTKGAFQLIQ
ncbi:MAG: efflux RND transporter periplasmic adaptor subunit [Crocinitomicaceae bacterium]|nr:efflux RND transporter periplasmic adaptor subunit [Crocinitomicaceae bacterium]